MDKGGKKSRRGEIQHMPPEKLKKVNSVPEEVRHSKQNIENKIHKIIQSEVTG